MNGDDKEADARDSAGTKGNGMNHVELFSEAAEHIGSEARKLVAGRGPKYEAIVLALEAVRTTMCAQTEVLIQIRELLERERS